jgi:diguanylate cyclase (GGDEF)-like protein
LFERALDCLPDGVLVIREGVTIVYANRAFEKMWNVAEGVIASGNDSVLLSSAVSQVANAADFLGEVKRLYGSSESSEDIVPLKDGRIISRRSASLEPEGVLQTRVWIFTDVTEARHARLDTLTGLPNRRAYAKEFPAFVLAKSDGLTRFVAIMDIDHFKRYNDAYGHAAGDLALLRIGALLRSRLTRSDDLVFRLGGEEFLIACKFRKRSAGASFFEDIRASIELENIEHSGNPPYDRLTSSFGVAVSKAPRDPDSVFRSADACLYQAKATGRNRVALDYTA